MCYGIIQLITFLVENKIDYGISIFSQFLFEKFAEIFSLLGYSVYLEIIELHFCELDKNLKRKIIVRGVIELKEVFDAEEIYNDDDEDDYSEQEESDIKMKNLKSTS